MLNSSKKFFLIGLLSCFGVGQMVAQQAVSGIFGYYNLTLLGNSDTIVSIPFARLPAATVQVASVAGNVVQFQGSPGWTNGQFVYVSGTQPNTYYIRIESGALEGRYFDVITNDATSLTLNLNGGSLATLATNDQVSVIPYWTFGTVFVNGNGIWPTTSSGNHLTDVLIPNTGGTGVNLSSAYTYYYFTNSAGAAWRRLSSSSTNRNDDILMPNTYMIIRHHVPTNTTFTSFGDVVLTKINVPLVINPTNAQDNFVSLTRPIQLSPNDTSLIASGAFAVSTGPGNGITDKLLLFDNTTTNFNKSAAATYYYYNSTWRKLSGGSTDYSTTNIFSPGACFIIRKASGTSIPQWINTPTYTNN